MEGTCRKAVELGLPAIAFTDHCDFVHAWPDQHPLDLRGYLESLERCRALFPGLRILSGIELGEPHRFPAEAAAMLGISPLDRVLASVHCVRLGGEPIDVGQGIMTVEDSPSVLRDYFAETLALVGSDQLFDVLAHLDYPKRYWPHTELPFREGDFEEEYRAILRALAARGAALEVNTTRGAEHRRGLCPGPAVLGWWRELGGERVSFGSDSHEPAKIAAGFLAAAALVEAAGFRPARDPAGFWLR